MPETTPEHAILLDKLACKTLMETYSYAEIERDPDLFASIWTDDARFGSTRGRENIRAASVEFFKAMEAITELRISPAGWHVEVDGDSAQGQFFIVSQLKIPQADGTVKVLHFDAGYRCRFTRTIDGWRIAEAGGIKDPNIFHDTDIMVQLEGKAKVSFDFS